jgi:hypothetical protein
MMSRIVRTKSRALKSSVIALGFLAALLFASASPAEARSKGNRVHSRSHVVHKVQKLHKPFVVPRHVSFRTVRVYDPFFNGRVFFSPHRHFHRVYRFPVVTTYGVVYQPYSYCGDELFTGGYVAFGGPHISARVRF